MLIIAASEVKLQAPQKSDYLDYNQLLHGSCDWCFIPNHSSSNTRYSRYLVLQLLFSEVEFLLLWQDVPTVSGTADFRLLLVRLMMCYPPLRYHANDWLALHCEAEFLKCRKLMRFVVVSLQSMGFCPYSDEDPKISMISKGEKRSDCSSLLIMIVTAPRSLDCRTTPMLSTYDQRPKSACR